MIYVANKNIGRTGGGDALVALEIIESLNTQGFDVAAIAMSCSLPDYLYENKSKIKQFTLPFIPVKENYQHQKYGALRYLVKRIQSGLKEFILKRQLNKYPPDLIITNDSLTGQYLAKIYSNRVKIIQVVHASPDFFEDYKDENLSDHFNLFRPADQLVFVSEASREKWLKYGEIEKNQTVTIHNCANETIATHLLNTPKETIRKQLGMNPDIFYLVAVASFNFEKGLDILIDAAPKLKRIAPNLEILVIGADKANYADHLREKAHYKESQFIKMLGYKTNAMDFIYSSDAFILPSRSEALPLVILESMILKTPVIATTVGGIPEMIDHKKSGLLFESENIEGLIKCFEAMYSSKEERINYAEQGSMKYWNTFSKKKFTESYNDIVKAFLDI